ncbi:Uncharacterised protein [Yersinia enterocolitica]|nr:Uncharacterised protein [Yersinia enterocolitica]
MRISPSSVEVIPSKFITRRPSVISNGIQLPSTSTLSSASRPKTNGLFALPPKRRLAFNKPEAFSPSLRIGLIIANEKLLIAMLPDRLRRPSGSATCTCPENWPLFTSLINQSARTCPLAKPPFKFSVSKAIGSGLPCTICWTLTPLPLSDTRTSGKLPPAFQLTSARPVNTPLIVVSGPRNGFIIAKSKRLSTTLACPLGPASIARGTQSSAFGLSQQCGPMVTRSSVFW